MTTIEAVIVGTAIGSLFTLAVFIEPPAFMVRLFGWLVGRTEAFAGWFRRGRHHQRAPLIARPFDERHPRPTPAQIRARIEREVKLVPRKYGRGYIAIDVDVMEFDEQLADVLDQLDAGRGVADQHAGIAG
ncbi:hypothetical protein AVT46_gp37 [Mycobacterium phage MOOREtheMARYer]|uniref:Uncharacterized protein n=1 Tax=Mycobacterium phage MOOREtheMARYer TaxID=1647309 RepID=A0A0F6WEK6_9CAUD|nr:hypothetical protein AVT46_gp37 [Mycobacterium phage MOOREtheMARYer]AKF14898.1 hypothetical protein SEA_MOORETHEMARYER_37 [Mycobacterium phage MOOREtheMARYer]